MVSRRSVANQAYSPFSTFVVLASMMLFSPARAQYSSLDLPVDARSVAMGESFVALRSNPGFLYNPAGIAAVSNAGATFSQRNVDWNDYFEDYRFLQFTAALPTPVAAFGLSYNRYQRGKFIVTGPAGPEPIDILHPYDHTVALTAAHSFDCGLDAGIALKMFDLGDVRTSTTPAFLVDFGFIYSFFGCDESLSRNNALTLGISFQNFGSYLIAKDATGLFEGKERLPRFIKTGIAYTHTVHPESESQLAPLTIVASAQFTGLLNDPTLYPDHTNSSGLGLEVIVFEIVSARVGAYAPPLNSIYGDKGTFEPRYGVGVTFPLTKLHVAPLRIGFDYGIIPLTTSSSGALSFGSNKSTLSAFSVTASYENDLF